MRYCLAFGLSVAALAVSTAPLTAAPLTADQGAVAFSGSLTDSGGRPGDFAVEATLAKGDFTGRGRITTSGYSVEGPIVRGYLENGRCSIRIENGRSRGEISGTCDTDRIGGRFETFHPGGGLLTGTVAGTARAAGVEDRPAGQDIPLPTAKLTCAYQDRKIGVGLGETTQYSLAYSNMVSLTLTASGTYAVGSGGTGQFARSGNKLTLTSGPYEGAVGTVELDRSGEPAVLFLREENETPAGVHRVDPYTTRCTRAR
ncbi:hypothetical protein [Azospirillum sp. SYSU D00513]|uniref:hypothetical protein n=1 Tax=Azospirillum sp. SYSU D00513 TaxID=2812561 RepID=UPI001A96A60E|nr:hypothetical protein [Azospirillum sp. SYSU D00513]